MPIERQACLQPERIAGAQPDRPHALVLSQSVPEGFRDFGRSQDLEAVLAGIARARDDQPVALIVHPTETHETQGGGFGQQPGQHGGGLRPLQRDQGAVVGAGQASRLARRRLEPGEVVVLGPRIDDNIEHARPIGLQWPADHQVVDHAPLVVQQ